MGLSPNTTSHTEKLISGLGAVMGIGLVMLVSSWWLDSEAAILLTASMGASAVLLFAVPHGALSQPWAVLGGHSISALIGVSCQWLWPGEWFTAPLAVGLAVTTMHYLRCIHPPGGATALTAVIGGSSIQQLGYAYLLCPVLLNVASILLVALLFNGLFHWRRYPASLAQHQHPSPPTRAVSINADDLTSAMEQLDSYIDVTEEDLLELFELAQEHAGRRHKNR